MSRFFRPEIAIGAPEYKRVVPKRLVGEGANSGVGYRRSHGASEMRIHPKLPLMGLPRKLPVPIRA